MAKRSPQSQDKYIVRFPDGMRERIAIEAGKSARSINAEIVSRLEHSLENDGEEEQERDDLWRELHKREAKIRQTEEDAYTKEKLLSDALVQYKTLVARQDAFLKAICYRVLQFKDAVPPDAFSLAENLLNADGSGDADWPRDDPTIAAIRYEKAVAAVVRSGADRQKLDQMGAKTLSAVRTRRQKRGSAA
jgi:hypothetical protein